MSLYIFQWVYGFKLFYFDVDMGLEKIFNPKGITPGMITATGAALCAGGLGLLIGGDGMADVYGMGFVGAGYAADWADGHVARRYDMKTREGARFDSLTDKIKFGFNGAYIIATEVVTGGVLLPLAVGTNFVVDYVSTRQRGPLGEQLSEAKRAVFDYDSCEKDVEESSSIRANYWGKTKAVMQMAAGLAFIGSQVVQNHLGQLDVSANDNIVYWLSAGLLTAATLGLIGVSKRVKKGKRKEE